MKPLARWFATLIALALAVLFFASAATADPITQGPANWATDFPDPVAGSATETLTGDVNGDGKSDGIAVAGGNWYIALSTGTDYVKNFAPWVSGLGAPDGAATINLLAGDVTGDGKADAVAVVNGSWYVARSTGTAFTAPALWVSSHGVPTSGVTTYPLLGDVNGDGKQDAVSMAQNTWRVALSNGSAFSAPSNWITIVNSQLPANGTAAKIGDVNGDGKADAVGEVESAGNWYVALSSGSSFSQPPAWATTGFGAPSGGVTPTTMVADTNNDGKADAIAATGSSWKVATSYGTAFNPPAQWSKNFVTPAAPAAPKMLVANVGGDAKQDPISVASGDWYAATSPAVASQITALGSDYTLKFSDDFTGSSLDTTKWRNQRADWITGGVPYNNLEGASYQTANNTFDGNNLIQTIKKQTVAAFPTLPYTTGSVNTQGKFDFKYGYVEANIRIPSCTGCWPAFWMLPSIGDWPPEIDIFEFFGTDTDKVPHANSHWGPAYPPTDRSTISATGLDYRNAFHKYGLLWTPTSLQLFVDDIAGPTYTGLEVPQQKMYLINTLQQGAGYDTGTTPVSMLTDYIRVYQAPQTVANDTTPPSLTITAPTAATKASQQVNVAVTSNEQLGNTKCQVDNGAWQLCDARGTSVIVPVPTGTHTVSVKGTDISGNSSTVTSPVFTMDAPRVSAKLYEPHMIFEANAFGLAVNFESSVASRATGGTAPFVQSNATCVVDGGPKLPSCEIPKLANGPHVLEITVVDNAGNLGYEKENVTVDSSLPVIYDIIPFHGNRQPDGSYFIKADNQVVVVSTNKPTTLEWTTNGFWETGFVPVLSGSFYDFNPFPVGAEIVFTVRATDSSGNVASKSVLMRPTSK